jgi:hypothetical protein
VSPGVVTASLKPSLLDKLTALLIAGVGTICMRCLFDTLAADVHAFQVAMTRVQMNLRLVWTVGHCTTCGARTDVVALR